jgi:hypothetical protein
MAVAGLEHGIGEILQGNRAPAGMTIESWPDSELFHILGGEPAMTIVPNLLVTGILASLVSLLVLVWVTLFVQRKHGGLVLILLSIVLLLVGGGFGPPLLGLILGVAATRIEAPLTWWRAHLAPGARRVLGLLWPWSLVADVIAWLCLFPGSLLLGAVVGANDPPPMIALLLYVCILAVFGLLLVTILTGFAHDMERQTSIHPAPSRGG